MSHRYYVTELGRVPTGAATYINGSDGDAIMLRYEWPGTLGGNDADTLTGIEPGTGTSIDGIKNSSGPPTRYVGYAAGGSTYTIGSSSDVNSSNCLFFHGGDNTDTTGQEVIIIRPKSIAAANTSIKVFRVGIYLNWYRTIGVGCMNFKMRVYSGGSFTPQGGSGKDITSTGTLLRTYTFNANTNNINNPNGTKVGYPSNGINGYSQVGIFTFDTDGNGIFRYNLQSVGNCTA
jgi:hypothetical protein